ncbi:MAG TPA: CmpA/NrtA family ABC transporter substrate-binding protein [Dongiaceae bacterium]|jgi:ABC-type nitrate/sulfonate/bicarbonate transport system substrate-binding protein|nr:CmpA/NrtA family ABC transporter substrate-binding protein [Dongiaceae bacterium]
MSKYRQQFNTAARPLRVGFVPLCDCAPLVIAQELGLFEKYGLHVHLSREVGWATVRDKIIYGELDAAHALAPMVFAASLGLGSVPAACVTGLVLSLNGNAITLSQTLADAGVRDGATLRAFTRHWSTPLIFGIPLLYSSHHFLLRAWLEQHGLIPGRDVQFVVVPPPQMVANLKAGHLHGYCVGEPWNAVATGAGHGWRAATSLDIAPHHPEKVLMVRREFAAAHPEQHERLIAALLEACHFCAAPENRERIIETLGEARYVNAPAAALRAGYDLTLDWAIAAAAAGETYEPTAAKAAWVLNHMRAAGLVPNPAVVTAATAAEVFRADIFQAARQLPAGFKKKFNLPPQSLVNS